MAKQSGSLVDRGMLRCGVALMLFFTTMAASVRGPLVQAQGEATEASAKVLPVVGQSRPVVSAEDSAHDFYQSYLQMLYDPAWAKQFEEFKKGLVRYVTARLMQKLASSSRTSSRLKGSDVWTDYFFGTLDVSSEWEKHITVSKPTTKGTTAVLRVTFSGTNPESKRLEVEEERKVMMKQEGGFWKIDDVDVWRE